MSRSLPVALVLALSLVACKERSTPPPVADDASLSGREFRPPTGKVRAVPPHNIHQGGVGPYRLGARLQDVLGLLPHGPRVELLQIEGLADYRLVRAERDALVIGVGRGAGVQFVAVLDPEIARTENGVGVGASPEELSVALGAVSPTEGGGRDPRLVAYASLPGTRFVVQGGQVVAAVVTKAVTDSPKKAASCDRDALADREVEVTATSKLPPPVTIVSGCFTGAGIDAVAYSGGRAVVVTGEAGKTGNLRRLASTAVPGLVFVAAVDTDGDGRDEIVTVAERRDADAYRLWVELHRVEGAKLVRIASRAAYSISASAATWVGAELADIELLAEVRGGGGELVLGGLFLHRTGGHLHSAVPLEPVTIAIRGGDDAESKAPAPEASPTDAGPPPPSKAEIDAAAAKEPELEAASPRGI